MANRNYRDLIAWQKAMDLIVGIYKLTVSFPKEETYGLTSQIRRAAVSIAANIAEGQGRGSDAELVRFCRIAHGSLREVETHLLIAGRLAYGDPNRIAELLEMAAEVGRLLNGLVNSKT